MVVSARHRRVVPPPSQHVPNVAFAVRELRFWLTNYRRTWRGSIYSSLLNPLLYLGALGLALGSIIDKHNPASLNHVTYLAFLAPGLLAATGMQTGIGESTYPVFGSVKWNKTYRAATASPLRPADVFHGHLLFVTFRVAMNCAIFLAVAAVVGAVHSQMALAALPVAVLTGVAFAAPVEAWTVTLVRDTSLPLIYRFGMIPLFLFSGTFFPISQLPFWLRPVAYVSPLWHGVTLCRSLVLGGTTWQAAAVHVAYLAVIAVAGVLVGQRTYTRRLHV